MCISSHYIGILDVRDLVTHVSDTLFDVSCFEMNRHFLIQASSVCVYVCVHVYVKHWFCLLGAVAHLCYCCTGETSAPILQ